MALISKSSNHYLADTDAEMVTPPINEGDTVYSYESQTTYILDNGVFREAIARKNYTLTNLTPASNDANTNEKVLHAIQIQSDVVAPGDLIEFFSQFEVTASANNKTFRVYIDATGDLTGAILIGTFTTSGAAVQMSTLYRFLPVLTDTSIEALASASTSVTGNYSQPNAVNTQITVPSLSAGFYIVITGQKASAGETLTCRWTQVTIKKQTA